MKNYLEKWLNELKEEIQSNLNSTGTNASGKTSKSIRVEMSAIGGRLLGRKAFGTVEDGRAPGKTPKDFNSIIRQWIIDKNISWQEKAYIRQPSTNWQPKYTPSERGLRAMAGAIANSIKVWGTNLYIIGGRNNIYTTAVKNKLPSLKKNIKFTITKNL